MAPERDDECPWAPAAKADRRSAARKASGELRVGTWNVEFLFDGVADSSISPYNDDGVMDPAARAGGGGEGGGDEGRGG